MATERLFETAPEVGSPWFVKEVRFDEEAKVLTIGVDFKAKSRFPFPGSEGERRHGSHDRTVSGLLQHPT